MNNKPVISAHNLSKQYNLYGAGGRADMLRDKLADIVKRNPKSSRENSRENNKPSTFWAVKDVSFDVYKGEVLGIIGRNGAGKSTLLKILSRIINPTSGSFEINGSVASLLEVGTGFHQELTGRENIFFNGALLGMSKQQIRERMDDIIAYSEIEDFIDVPVKRYSSGMSVRLGFAIAANLDAEIMIIDEALAVGDAAFKQKSQEVMRNRATSGKTIIFVSHSMGAIEQICDRAIYLDKGRVVSSGGTKETIERYLGGTLHQSFSTTWSNRNSLDKKKPSPRIMKLQDSMGEDLKFSSIDRSDGLSVYCEINIPKVLEGMSVGISLLTESEMVVFRSTVNDQANGEKLLRPGLNKLRTSLPTDILKPGNYFVAFDINVQHQGRIVHPVNTEAKTRFTLSPNSDNPLGYDPRLEGVIKPSLVWETVKD